MTRTPEQQLKVANALAQMQRVIQRAIKRNIPDATDDQCRAASFAVMIDMGEVSGVVFGLPEEVTHD